MNAISLEQDGAVARLLINNPQRRNALSRAMWRAIEAACDQIREQDTASVLVLASSTPGCFAAGADISEFEANYASAASASEVNTEIHRAIDALQACPMPSVALIDGPCVGGGLALALAADIRLASPNARFAVTPSKLGLSYHPDDVRRLMSACGKANASELLFGAQVWSAERGLQAGLVNQLIETESFDSASKQLIEAICQNSRAANGILKQTVSSVESNDVQAIQASEAAFDELFLSEDFIAGRDAFLSKSPVQFPSNKRDT
ncbi:MAG: enoyl-CoA hydratase/isomerase family protein [Burkholderiaceae bacterium]